jgi:hypothetical protein
MNFAPSARGLAPRLVTAIAIIAMTACAAAAQRSDRGRAPWCGNLAGHGLDDCNYYTFEQCLVSVHGLGGACARNPRATAIENGRRPRGQRRVYR